MLDDLKSLDYSLCTGGKKKNTITINSGESGEVIELLIKYNLYSDLVKKEILIFLCENQ